MLMIWIAPTKIKNSLIKHASGGAPAMLSAAIVPETVENGILLAKPPILRISRSSVWCMMPPAVRKKRPLLAAWVTMCSTVPTIAIAEADDKSTGVAVS